MADLAAGPGWREPTSALELRWGGYRARYLVALTLVMAGGLLAQAASTYTVYFLSLGVAAHIAGWIVLPARGGRRIAVALPSALLACAPLIGSAGTVALVVPLVCWLYLRQRPGLSYLVCLLPIASGLVLAQLYPQYGDGGIVVGVSLAVLVGSAWLARWIARVRPQGRSRA